MMAENRDNWTRVASHYSPRDHGIRRTRLDSIHSHARIWHGGSW